MSEKEISTPLEKGMMGVFVGDLTNPAETETKPKADINFAVGYGAKTRKFHLRIISVAEENEISEQFTALNSLTDESEKSLKEYAICVAALRRFTADGFDRPEFPSAPDVKTERVVRKAFLLFKGQLEPEASFL